MKDEKYDREVEHENAENLPRNLFSLPKKLTMSDLQEIQEVHDDVACDEWDATKFINKLNKLSIFRSVKKVKVK